MSAIEFEVYLIMTMVCDQEIRDQALDRLGVSNEVADGIRRDVSDMTRLAPGQVDRLVALLGEDADVDVSVEGGAVSTLISCAFGTWPGFLFQVRGNEQGFWTDSCFVRAPGVSIQRPSRPSELQPWSSTLEEVENWFGPLVEGDSWPPFSEYGVFYSENGRRLECDMVFSWGLLQQVRLPG